uniref:CSON006044 protein n=1 Tax=Culicoides sonorensis TaxID=179676 RepID=A0A336LIQ3_CULSO
MGELIVDKRSSGIPAPWKGRKYKRVYHENYEAYLKEIGMNPILRKLAAKVPTSVRLIKQQDEYIWRTESTLQSTEVIFKDKEEFLHQRPFLPPVKVNMYFEGFDNCRLIQKGLGDIPFLVVNEFTEKELVQTMTCNGVACKLFFRVV